MDIFSLIGGSGSSALFAPRAKEFNSFSLRHSVRLLAAQPLRSPLKICHRHIFFTLRRGENPLTQPRPRGTGLGRPDGMMSAQPPWAAFTNDRHRGPRKGAERLWRGEEEQAKRGEVSLSAGPDKAQLVLTRCGGGSRGKRRSAACGGCSKPLSRQRRDWRPQRGRESQCRNGVSLLPLEAQPAGRFTFSTPEI